MSNPIDNGPRPTAPGALTSGKGQKVNGSGGVAAEAGRTTRAGGEDEAALSDRLQTIRDRIEETPEIDRERVDALKERIANGDYPVDAEKVARKFAELEALINDDE